VEGRKIDPRRPPLPIPLLISPYYGLHRRQFRCTLTPATMAVAAEATYIAYRTVNFRPIYIAYRLYHANIFFIYWRTSPGVARPASPASAGIAPRLLLQADGGDGRNPKTPLLHIVVRPSTQ